MTQSRAGSVGKESSNMGSIVLMSEQPMLQESFVKPRANTPDSLSIKTIMELKQENNIQEDNPAADIHLVSWDTERNS